MGLPLILASGWLNLHTLSVLIIGHGVESIADKNIGFVVGSYGKSFIVKLEGMVKQRKIDLSGKSLSSRTLNSKVRDRVGRSKCAASTYQLSRLSCFRHAGEYHALYPNFAGKLLRNEIPVERKLPFKISTGRGRTRRRLQLRDVQSSVDLWDNLNKVETPTVSYQACSR